MTKILPLILLILLIKPSSPEVFSALVDLEALVHTESLLIDFLDKQTGTQGPHSREFERYARTFRLQHEKASKDIESYVANPINAYLLVKRLTADWWDIRKLLNDTSGQGNPLISAHPR